MVRFIDNNQWVELPLEAVCNLFVQQDEVLGIFPRIEPITLEDGTVIDVTSAKIKLIEIAIQKHLDAAAKVKGYDSIHTAALRTAYVGPFQAEGLAYAQWMDTCWSVAYTMLADYQAGTIQEPTVAEVIAALPVLTGV